jgi:hypothetical protein
MYSLDNRGLAIFSHQKRHSRIKVRVQSRPAHRGRFLLKIQTERAPLTARLLGAVRLDLVDRGAFVGFFLYQFQSMHCENACHA